MAYRKTYRKRTYRKRGPKATIAKKMVEGKGMTKLERLAWGAGAVASLARAVVPYIKANNAEAKYFDVIATQSPVSATIGLNNLSNMSQGLTDITRVGNSIKIKDLRVRYTIIPNFTSSITNIVRIMIFVDKSQGGVAPLQTQIFESSTTFNSPLNKDFSDRFVVLRDSIFPLAQGSADNLTGDIYLKMDYHVRYLGPGNAVGDQGPGTVYLLSWSNQVTNSPTISYYTRLNYYDN